MGYNERLMNEALQGSKSSKKELESNAGAGSVEAQYYLAIYYSKADGGEQNSNYQYWMKKAVDNGYSPAFEKSKTLEPEKSQEEMEANTKGGSDHDVWFYLGFEGRVSRSFYIFATIVYFILSVTITGLLKETSQDSSGFLTLVLAILGLVLWGLWIAQAVKRIHDLNHSGWWLILPFVPIWLFFAKGINEKNDYGDPM